MDDQRTICRVCGGETGGRLDIGALVQHLGGVVATARRFKVSHPSVSKWVKANSIPTRHAEVIALMMGIDRDWLHDPWGDSRRLTPLQMGRLLQGDDPYSDAAEQPLIDDDDMFDYSQPVNWDEDE